jgi:rhodanese-related sulfurtransferase
VRSFHAARYLESAGFLNVVNLSGGVAAWADEVDPAMPRY